MKTPERCLLSDGRVACVVGVACAALLILTPRPILARKIPLFGLFAKTATVSFEIEDAMGNINLQGGKVKSFKNLHTGSNLAARFHLNRFLDQEARKVPFGHYDLVFAQPGFPDLERPVDVLQSEVDVEVCVTRATVHLVPLYASGAPMDLEPKVVSFKGDDYGLDLASSFKANTAKKVPYGLYELLVEERGFAPFKEQVYVLQPEVWVLAALQVGGLGPASPQMLSGIVKNLDPNEEPIYIRLVSVFPNGVGSSVIESKIDVTGNSGTFDLEAYFRLASTH